MNHFTEDQLALMRECRMLGWSLLMIAKLLGLQSPAAIQICCLERKWSVPLAQFDSERARCSDGAINGAAALLTNKGHSVDKIDEQLFRLDGKPVRAALLFEMANSRA